MSATTQVTTNGSIVQPATHVTNILVAYDDALAVTVTPSSVTKGTTARFTNPDGDQLRIVFVSPLGKESDQVLDSDVCTFDIGGAYHFKCFFKSKTNGQMIQGKTGGVLDVVPHRP
ncbi:MAG: hypothetical protein WA738_07600 [Candidatus Angelobacter sp.]